MEWIKHKNRLEIIEHHLEFNDPGRIHTHDYSTWLVSIGQYCENRYWQVSYDSFLHYLFDKERNFISANNCKKYVGKRLKDWTSIVCERIKNVRDSKKNN